MITNDSNCLTPVANFFINICSTAYSLVKIASIDSVSSTLKQASFLLEGLDKGVSLKDQKIFTTQSEKVINSAIETLRPDLKTTQEKLKQKPNLPILPKKEKKQVDQLYQYLTLFLEDRALSYLEENASSEITVLTIEKNKEIFTSKKPACDFYKEAFESDYIHMMFLEDLPIPGIRNFKGLCRIHRSEMKTLIQEQFLPITLANIKSFFEKDETIIYTVLEQAFAIGSDHLKDFAATVTSNNLAFDKRANDPSRDAWVKARKIVSEQVGNKVFTKIFPNKGADLPGSALEKILGEYLCPIFSSLILELSLSNLMTPRIIDKILLNLLESLPPPKSLEERSDPEKVAALRKNLPQSAKERLPTLEQTCGKLVFTSLFLGSPHFHRLFEWAEALTAFQDKDALKKKVQQLIGQSIVNSMLEWMKDKKGDQLFTFIMERLDENFTIPSIQEFKALKNTRKKTVASAKQCTEQTLENGRDSIAIHRQILEQEQQAEDFVLQQKVHKEFRNQLSNFYPYLAHIAIGTTRSALESLLVPSSWKTSKYYKKFTAGLGSVTTGARSAGGWILSGIRELTLGHEYNHIRSLEDYAQCAAGILRLCHSPYHEQAVHQMLRTISDQLLSHKVSVSSERIKGLQKNIVHSKAEQITEKFASYALTESRKQPQERGVELPQSNVLLLPPVVEGIDIRAEREKELVGESTTLEKKKIRLLKARDLTLGLPVRLFRRTIRPTAIAVESFLANSFSVWSNSNFSRSVVAITLIGFATLIIIPFLSSFGVIRMLCYDAWRPLSDNDWVRKVNKGSTLSPTENWRQGHLGNYSRWLLGAVLPSKGHLVCKNEDESYELTTRIKTEDRWIIDLWRKWDLYICRLGLHFTQPENDQWRKVLTS